MTKFNVHLYREMRLAFVGIEADTPEAAAAIVRGKPTEDADNIEDCEGENLAALVDFVDDQDYLRSVMVDFEGERQRRAAPKLLASLSAILPYAESEAYSLEKLKDSPQAEAEARRAWNAVETAQAVIAQAEAAGNTPDPITADIPARFVFEHFPADLPDRASVEVEAMYSIVIIRTVEGLVIDVYPKDWDAPIDTMTVWDDQTAELERAIPGEA
jgi:hypothetical protein